MKKFTIEELKKNILTELKYESFCIDDEERKYCEKIVDKLIDELCDVSKKELKWLDERETFIIRKLLGILDNGNCQTQASVAKLVNLTPSQIATIKKKIFNKWRLQIYKYSFAILPKTFDNNITLLDPIQKLELTFMNFIKLHRRGIKTIEDITLLEREELIEKFDGICQQEVENTIHKYGFTFKNENIIKSTHQNIPYNIEDLNLSVKAFACLSRLYISTIPELIY